MLFDFATTLMMEGQQTTKALPLKSKERALMFILPFHIRPIRVGLTKVIKAFKGISHLMCRINNTP